MNNFRALALLTAVFSLAADAQSVGRQVLKNHVPAAAANARRSGPLSRMARLNLSIGLPLQNTEDLDRLISGLTDPASPSYRNYLTPQQFAEQFGPTELDYQTLIDFTVANGLTVSGTHPNRMILDIAGPVWAIESAFHVNLIAWNDRRRGGFFAPDREPSLDLDMPILDITGLDNYVTPKPMDVTAQPFTSTSFTGTGSGPAGLLLGKDFRSAYAPGVALTGAGQTIGLFELDGFYAADVLANFKAAGLPAVPVQTVLLDGYSGAPGGGNIEVMLDIMMAAYVAPGAKIIVYEGYNWNDVLNRMATDNLASQLSCSWGFSPINGTTEQIFRQMIAQGQSFFQASGDSGAYSGWIMPPSDNPNVTVVGGTALATSGAGGPWLSESVWPGSGGGVSTTYSIPSYQLGMNMGAVGGSTSMRNIPDVALTAAVQMYLIENNGQAVSVGGTSAAAPLWAGFMALANQQAQAAGKPSVGFVNPAIYAIGNGSSYKAGMHDIVTGNNYGFNATPGFDLATGWGTPSGQSLIDQLTTKPAAPAFLLSASAMSLSLTVGASAASTISVVPENGFSGKVSLAATGLPAGVTASFSASGVLTLTAGTSALAGASIVTVSGTSGTLVTTLALALRIGTPSFTLTASPMSVSVAQGSSANSVITVTPQDGFVGKVTFTATGLPAGVTASFSASGALTLSAAASAVAGTSTVTVTGTSGTLSKALPIAVSVTAAPNFTLSAAPASVNVIPGTNGTSAITVVPQNGFNSKVALVVSGLPTGVSASFNSTGTLTLAAATTAAPVTASVTVTGTSGSLTKTVAIALNVTPASTFTLSATPASLSVAQGATGTSVIAVVPQGGFSGTVTLAASGLPAGVSAAFSASRVLTLTATSSAVIGPATVTVTGTSGTLIGKTPISLSITGVPDFTLSAPVSALNILKGFSGRAVVSVTPIKGFTGTVSFAATGLATGVSASFTQNFVTFSAAASAVAGTSAVTITGTSGGLVRTAKIGVTILAPVAGTVPVDLSTVYNVIGVAADGVPFTTGGLDAGGRALSGYILGSSQTIAGVPFAMGLMSAPDAVSGKTVPLPVGQFSAIKLLATGVNGNQPSQKFIVTYTDGTTSTFIQGVSDWFTPQRYSGEATGITTNYRDNSTGTTEGSPFLVYEYSFALTSGKKAGNISLPVNSNVVVLAMTLTGGQ